jgi:hypothetical protein
VRRERAQAMSSTPKVLTKKDCHEGRFRLLTNIVVARAHIRSGCSRPSGDDPVLKNAASSSMGEVARWRAPFARWMMAIDQNRHGASAAAEVFLGFGDDGGRSDAVWRALDATRVVAVPVARRRSESRSACPRQARLRLDQRGIRHQALATRGRSTACLFRFDGERRHTMIPCVARPAKTRRSVTVRNAAAYQYRGSTTFCAPSSATWAWSFCSSRLHRMRDRGETTCGAVW